MKMCLYEALWAACSWCSHRSHDANALVNQAAACVVLMKETPPQYWCDRSCHAKEGTTVPLPLPVTRIYCSYRRVELRPGMYPGVLAQKLGKVLHEFMHTDAVHLLQPACHTGAHPN